MDFYTLINKKYVNYDTPFCTHCGAKLTDQPGFNEELNVWICEECQQPLVGSDSEDKRYPGVVQICEKCGVLLDNQEGYSDWFDEWECASCGYVNQIEDSEYASFRRLEFEKKGGKNHMTVEEARIMEEEFYRISNPTREQEFLYEEVMSFLIAEENNPEDMMHLGSYYYAQKKFELAVKYYEMASVFGADIDECLGYIWYYGRTGEINYKKAFDHFSRAMMKGNVVAAYKIADMYKYGYHVEKDYKKYVSMIEELYPKVCNAKFLQEPLPEVYIRLAEIRVQQEEFDEAITLYLTAKDFLAQRLSYTAFWGDLNIMKALVYNLYELIDFNEYEFDFYDLYYLMKSQVDVCFTFEDKVQKLEVQSKEQSYAVRFNDQWYCDVDEFYQQACIDNEKLTAIYDCLENFEVL